MTPTALAEKIVDLVKNEDSNTASAALSIARILLDHRDQAQHEFEIDCFKEQMES